jgi:hypothetical protein
VIGAVETLIGNATMPEEFVEPHDVRRWLDLHGDEESRVVYRTRRGARWGFPGKQVIHPSHIHPCKVGFTPRLRRSRRKIAILQRDRGRRAAGGAIKFDGEMLDRRCSARRCRRCLKAHALHALSGGDTRIRDRGAEDSFPAGGARNWPYGVIL